MADTHTTAKATRRPRPTSPHLSVYRPQITSITSITHRATGVFLLLGAFIYVWELYALAKGGESLQCYLDYSTSWCGITINLLWMICLTYHLLNGIRHLAWDMGKGLEIRTAKLTGYTVVGATLLVATLLIIVTLQTMGIV